jgi:hypothetical protein
MSIKGTWGAAVAHAAKDANGHNILGVQNQARLKAPKDANGHKKGCGGSGAGHQERAAIALT